MYAIKLTTDVYHLVQRGGQDTLCGLRISRVSSVRNAGGLQMADELPVTKKVCKHCERIKSQDEVVRRLIPREECIHRLH
jgi:hypothetical protein